MLRGEGQGPLGGFEVQAEMALRLFSFAWDKKYTLLGGDFSQFESSGSDAALPSRGITAS